MYIEQVGDRTLADCKVLIVDDQASSRLVLETLLEDTVACASVGSGKEAIEYCKYHTPDLILMDVSMPELDGHQTTALLRKKHRVIPQNLRPRHYNLHCLALDANAVLPA